MHVLEECIRVTKHDINRTKQIDNARDILISDLATHNWIKLDVSEGAFLFFEVKTFSQNIAEISINNKV